MKTNFPNGAPTISTRPAGSPSQTPRWARLGSLSRVLSAALVLAAVTGCDRDKLPARLTAVKSVDDRFTIKVGDRVVQVQVVALEHELQQGLMYRQSMGADEGMLFVFPQPRQQGFWIHNTTLPLDIGYFDPAGELKEIYPMYPLDERTVPSHSKNIQFCLEMSQGWYQRAGVRPGAKIDLGVVADALRARGLRPEGAGLK